MSFYSSLYALRGCKIRLIFLIIKIMGKEFFGKVIDHYPPCAGNGIPPAILAGEATPAIMKYEY